MVEAVALRPDQTRRRKRSVKIDKEKIAQRIQDFFDNDTSDRSEEIDARLQRYAKFRMWTEGKTWPWADATDFANPDMMASSMRLQDTLHNAVMSQRPTVTVQATKPADKDKEEPVSELLDYQFFEEQSGEKIIGDIADDFVNEGLFTAYIPWVEESRMTREVRVFPTIPTDVHPIEYFQTILSGLYPQTTPEPNISGWDWKLTTLKGKRVKVSFFTNDDDEIEAEIESEVEIFNGPRIIRKDIHDVFHPARCDNLQIPGPSNPTGASHVILRDYPTVDEIKRLHKNGFYDLMTDKDAEKLGIKKMDKQHQEKEEQKDTFGGHTEGKAKPVGSESHEPLTRLMCFDSYDINGDGLDEDVIFWYLLEEKIVLKAKYMTQMFPSSPPMRPLAEAQLFPVPGRRYAIGLLELMEGMHDLIKQFFDQAGDAGTLANAPFGFYRPTSNIKPESIRLWPGEMYAVSDPKNDVFFPQMGNQSQTFALNMISKLEQSEERLTTIGDLQLGRVPQGKSSALRTVKGMQTVLGQGDARPERVLRRFFMGIKQIFKQMHTLNKTFLPKGKQFRISGFTGPDKDPYKTIQGTAAVQGDFQYTFKANVLNTSKEATQAALQEMIGTYVNALSLQLGTINGEGIFRLMRDYGVSLGQDPDKYLTPPGPDVFRPPIFAEDAISMIMEGQDPIGPPAEGFQKHLETLQEWSQSDEFELLDPNFVPLAKAYLERIAAQLQQFLQQQQLLQAANEFGGGAQGVGQGGDPGERFSSAPLQDNELSDESLPGAGGGANTGQT